jgi:phosphatidylserine decarboxylase
LAAVVGLVVSRPAGLALVALPILLALFFRDPDRAINTSPDAVLSPADGRVLVAGRSVARGFPEEAWQQISIFLSPLDVHVNRTPVGGRVVSAAYHPGKFLPAYNRDATDLNEHTEVVMDRNGQQVVFRQIVGVLARRIVCRVRAGDVLQAGDRVGVMKFGSRMDVFVPRHAVLEVRVGDRVTAGVTRLATLPAAPAPGTRTGEHVLPVGAEA